MQPSNTTFVSNGIDQPGPIVDRTSFNDYRRLIRLVEKGRFIFKTNDLSSVPEDPDIINIQKLFEIEAMKTKQLMYDKKLYVQDRITINISGVRFETLTSTLAFYPDTLLGNEERRKLFYDPIHHDYFFNRHRACFDAILYYYQSNGRLRRPNSVPIDTFLEEITFFDLGEEALAQVRKEENLKEFRKILLPRNRFRRYLWATLEYPEFSFIAKCVQILSMIVILVSLLVLTVESLPNYKNLSDGICSDDDGGGNSRTVNPANSTVQSLTAESNCQTYFSSPFVIIQTVCVIYFTVELLLRMISMPSLCNFIQNFMNWIDIVVIVPFYVGIAFFFINSGSNAHSKVQAALQLLRILRFARVFKFYRLFRTIKSIRVLAVTLRESFVDFIILVVILSLLALLFGAFVFYVENDISMTPFNSIPTATYWGIITVTTVGYGDLAPVTVGGRITACFCALSGTGTIAMLTSVIVDRYQRVYTRRMYIKPEKIRSDNIFNNEQNDLESEPHNQDRGSRIVNNEDDDADDNVQEQQEDIVRINQNQYPTERKDDEESSDPSVIDTVDRDGNQVYLIVSCIDNGNSQIPHDLPNTISTAVPKTKLAGSNNEVNVIF